MGYLAWLCVMALFVSALGCGSTHKKTAKDHSASSPDTTKNDTIPPPPPPGLSPNTNRIKGEILAVQPGKNGQNGIIKVRILKSLGTGSSAPVIAPDDTLDIKMPNLSDSLKSGMKFIGILQYHEVMAQFSDDKSRWILVDMQQEMK